MIDSLLIVCLNYLNCPGTLPEVEGTWVNIDKIEPLHPPDSIQPGTGMSKADYLAKSIAENKFKLEHAIPVIKIADGRYIQVGGHHRVEALRRLVGHLS